MCFGRRGRVQLYLCLAEMGLTTSQQQLCCAFDESAPLFSGRDHLQQAADPDAKCWRTFALHYSQAMLLVKQSFSYSPVPFDN